MTQTEIRQVVANEFALFEQEYQRTTFSSVQLMQEVNDYVDRRSGKRLRPLLVLLCNGGMDTPRAVRLAAAVEILHSASLMHDDVVDMSTERRGQDSVNGRWGNQVAVLCGDYYLSRVMAILNDLNDPSASALVDETVKTMCEGELLQLQYQSDHKFDSSRYMDIIYRKTGALMTTCCELGNPALKQYGVCFGTAFQLRDDLLDYDSDDASTLPPKEFLLSELHRMVEGAVASLDKMTPSVYINALKELACNLLDVNL